MMTTETKKVILSPRPKQLPWYRRLKVLPFVLIAVVLTILCYPASMIGRGMIVSAYIKDGQHDAQYNQLENARISFNNAMDWSISNEQAFDERWSLASRTGDYATAIQDFSTVIANHPDRYMAYCFRGNANRKAEQIPAAIADYHACLDRNPSRIWRISAENILSVLEQ